MIALASYMLYICINDWYPFVSILAGHQHNSKNTEKVKNEGKIKEEDKELEKLLLGPLILESSRSGGIACYVPGVV